MSITLENLIKIKESLRECKPDVEDFSWGPSLEFAEQRKKEALKILNAEIKLKQGKVNVRNE
jgi:hypothetical protein